MARESEVGKLTVEQKRAVLLWIDEGLSLRAAAEKMGCPEPEGLGIATSAATLSRWLPVWRQEQLFEQRGERVEQARALALRGESEGIDFQRATLAALQQRIFESALENRRQREQRETLQLILDYQVKMRRLDLAERKLEESKRQFEFNAARAALKYWHQLKAIHEECGLDDEEKIWKTREVLFIDPANGETPQCNGSASDQGK